MPFTVKFATQASDAADVCAAAVSTVLFHRCFGSIEPSTSEIGGVTYPIAKAPEPEAIVAQARKEMSILLMAGGLPTKAYVTIDFTEHKAKKNQWFGKHHEPAWESWKLEFDIESKSEDSEQAAASLKSALTRIVLYCDSNKSEIPPITTTDTMPFPATVHVHT